MKTIWDNPVYQGFVSPKYCRMLADAGVTRHVPFFYRVVGTTAQLNTYIFDQVDFYRQTDQQMDDLSGVKPEFIPAYQAKDIEKVIPHYLFERCEAGYKVMCESLYGLDEQTDERMPDAFAKMLLEGIRKRIVLTSFTNKVIEATMV